MWCYGEGILIWFISCNFAFRSQVVAEVGANAPGVSIFTLLKAKAKVHVKRKFVPPKPAKRKQRGPVYYKSVSVDYDEAEGRLKLPPGTFVGDSVKRDVGDEDRADNSEIVPAFEDEGSDLAGRHIRKLSHQARDNY